MKKLLFIVLGVTLFSAAGLAQKGNNHISIAAEGAIPTGDAGDVSSFGYGGTVKGLYGIGTAGQVTLTTGYLTFSAKKEIKDLLGADKITNSIIPVLAGYRHNFNGFFAEPQVGYSFSNSKVKGGQFASKDSDGAFTWAAGVGYLFDKIEVGARYQSMHKDGESSALIGLRVGYNF
jgi:predicted porin